MTWEWNQEAVIAMTGAISTLGLLVVTAIYTWATKQMADSGGPHIDMAAQPRELARGAQCRWEATMRAMPQGVRGDETHPDLPLTVGAFNSNGGRRNTDEVSITDGAATNTERASGGARGKTWWLGILLGGVLVAEGIAETVRLVRSGDGGFAFWFGTLVGGGVLIWSARCSCRESRPSDASLQVLDVSPGWYRQCGRSWCPYCS